jgi:hypothetical protein
MLLMAYVDRRLDVEARESLEAHFVDCDSCLGQVSFLVHSAVWADPSEVPPPLLARARHLVSDNRSTAQLPGWRWAAVTAAAALVLITFTIVITLRLHHSETQRSAEGQQVTQKEPERRPAAVPQVTPAPRNPDVVASAKTAPSARTTLPRAEPSAPQVRNAEPDISAPRLILPREGAVLKREKLEFRWQTLPDAIFYEVSIVTAAGDPVMVRQTERTRLELSPDVQLISGAKYFVSIRAHLREGKTARSNVVSFRVSE